MKRNAWVGVLAAMLAIGLAGCEWETGSGAESWSSSYDWVNFSGTYRGSTTIPLDPDYTPGSTNIHSAVEASWILSELHTSLSGQVRHKNIVPGSVKLTTTTGVSLTDIVNKNGALLGDAGTGSISYDTGAWTFNLLPAFAPAEDTVITVSYAYMDITEESGTEFGTTEVDAYSYVVEHNGQHLAIIDNTGASYAGQITKINSASGAQNTDIGQVGADEAGNDNVSQRAKYTYYESPLPEDGDQVIASFEVSGSGGKIVGTLSGLVSVGVITERRMDATKISAGSTDDINATAPAVTITIVTPSADTNQTEQVQGETTTTQTTTE